MNHLSHELFCSSGKFRPQSIKESPKNNKIYFFHISSNSYEHSLTLISGHVLSWSSIYKKTDVKINRQTTPKNSFTIALTAINCYCLNLIFKFLTLFSISVSKLRLGGCPCDTPLWSSRILTGNFLFWFWFGTGSNDLATTS